MFIYIIFMCYFCVISARLPFQTLSVSKSPDSTNNVPTKKRKVISPLEEFKSNKITKTENIDQVELDVCQESDSDSDVALLSSDTEDLSELEKSKTSINDEKIRKPESPTTPTTPKSDKDAKMKLKILTPKQLEKRQEIDRKKEERARMKKV